MAELERLQKYLARAGICSRRRCEELILAGRIGVNGATVSKLGTRIDPDKDAVALDGKRVKLPSNLVYVMLNKPAGVVTTSEEQWGRPTVIEAIVKSENIHPPGQAEQESAASLSNYRLFPVGRLDLDSEGLLILTNDGELTNRLIHPRYALDKEYLVMVSGRTSEEALNRLRQGVEIGGKTTAPAEITLSRVEGNRSWLKVIIHEGRKRQIRRMFEIAGYPVQYLRRVRIGPLGLGRLPTGKYRFLTSREVHALQLAVGLTPAETPPITSKSHGRKLAQPARKERTTAKSSGSTLKNRHRRP